MNKKVDLVFYFFIVMSLLLMIFNENIAYNNLKSLSQMPVKPLISLVKFTSDILSIEVEYEKILLNYGNYMMKYRINKSIEKENITLKTMLDMKEKSKYRVIAAEIIGGEFIENSYLIIDKGRYHGIVNQMPAIFINGIIGKIIETGYNSAIVETYNNINFKVGITNKEKSFFGIASKYTENLLVVNNVRIDAHIVIGDTIYTSGLGQLFPPEIPVGIIENIEKPENTYKRIYIKPIEDIKGIKFVFIIKKENYFIFEKEQKNEKEIGKIGWFSIRKKLK